MKWVRKNNPQSRIILFYENPVIATINPCYIDDDICEKYSCDPSDCLMYNLKYIYPFYFEHLKIEKMKSIIDVLYVGSDKGRANKLFKLKSLFENQGVGVELYIVADRKYQRFYKKFYRPYLTYDEIREKNKSCRAILHIKEGGQCGITVRVFESLFNEIKLITNNEKLREYPFYRENNIFILGKDPIELLPLFLKKPYESIDDELIKKYSFDNWLEKLLLD